MTFLPALNSAKWQKQLRISSDTRVWLGDLCDLEGGSAERDCMSKHTMKKDKARALSINCMHFRGNISS